MIDPTRCPLCHQLNACALEIEKATGVAQPPCWCLSEQFSADLLDRVPAAARGRVCVCQACATAATEAAATTAP